MNIQVDLKRNPKVADLIADMQMGDSVSFITTLKSKNDSLAEFTLDRAEEGPEKPDDGDGEDSEGEAEDAAEGDTMKDHAPMPAPGGSRNTPGGSSEQDKMAAALTAQL